MCQNQGFHGEQFQWYFSYCTIVQNVIQLIFTYVVWIRSFPQDVFRKMHKKSRGRGVAHCVAGFRFRMCNKVSGSKTQLKVLCLFLNKSCEMLPAQHKICAVPLNKILNKSAIRRIPQQCRLLCLDRNWLHIYNTAVPVCFYIRRFTQKGKH